MKCNCPKSLVVAAVLACCLPFGSGRLSAQTDVALDAECGGSLAFTLDKKLARGLHLSLDEEVRMDNNFTTFNRFHTTLALGYKVNGHLKLAAGYALINGYSAADNAFKSPRHRLMVDATGSVRFGDWRLSLKERLQATYRSGDMNEYQNPRTALALKSRLKLQYKGLRRFEPYAAVELRNTLNAPTIAATYNTATDLWGYYIDGTFYKKGDAGWFLDGFNKVYVNRLRCVLGFEYSIDRRSAIDISLFADRVMDYVVDANAEGTKLKAYTYEKGWVGWLAVNYTYSF